MESNREKEVTFSVKPPDQLEIPETQLSETSYSDVFPATQEILRMQNPGASTQLSDTSYSSQLPATIDIPMSQVVVLGESDKGSGKSMKRSLPEEEKDSQTNDNQSAGCSSDNYEITARPNKRCMMQNRYHNLQDESMEHCPNIDDFEEISSSPIIGKSKYNSNYGKLLKKVQTAQGNLTSASTGERRIVLIKPEENLAAMMRSPSKFTYEFHKTKFGKADIKDMRTNFPKGILVVEMQNSEDIILHDLLGVTSIGSWKVKCYPPVSESCSVGVIGPISTEEVIDLETEIITNTEVEVIKVERLMRSVGNGQRVPSESVKLTFNSPNLPRTVKIFHFSYFCRPFVPNPIQCFRCQRLGHVSGSCKATSVRCLICSGRHSHKECPDKSAICCANCRGDHLANSRKCKFIEEANNLEKIKSHEKNRIQNNNNNSNLSFPKLTRQDTNYEIQNMTKNSTYAMMVSRNKSGHANQKEHVSKTTIFKDASTQTENSEQAEHKRTGNEITIEKLAQCLLDILSHNIFNENSQVRQQMIKGAVQKSFGVTIPKTSKNPEATESEVGSIEDGVLSDTDNDNIWEGKQSKKKKSQSERAHQEVLRSSKINGKIKKKNSKK